jgi:hypothetical protein
MWDLMIESYARPAVLWDNLSAILANDDYATRSNDAMTRLKDILTSPQMIARGNSTDKAAKVGAFPQRLGAGIRRCLSRSLIVPFAIIDFCFDWKA